MAGSLLFLMQVYCSLHLKGHSPNGLFGLTPRDYSRFHPFQISLILTPVHSLWTLLSAVSFLNPETHLFFIIRDSLCKVTFYFVDGG